MKLLVIGGSKHGEYMEHQDARKEVVVPLPNKVTAVTASTFWNRYCIHGSSMPSINDSDRHFISAAAIARLYGLADREWFRADRGDLPYQHRVTEYCVFPDYFGKYDRRLLPSLSTTTLPPKPSIEVERYNARIVSDRLVWVFVGN